MAYIIAYFMSFMVYGVSVASVGPTLPGLAAQLAVSLGGISFLVAARSIGRVTGTFAGRSVDRFPGNPIIAGALFIIGMIMMITSTVPAFLVLIPIWFVLGVNEGLMDVSVNTMLIWSRNGKAGALILAIHACFGIGAFFAPIIIAQVIGQSALPVFYPFDALALPTRLAAVSPAYFVIGLIIAPVALLVIRLPSPTMPKGEPEEADHTSAKTNMRLVMLISVFLTLYVAAEASISSWIFAYALGRDLTTEATGVYLVSVYWGMVTVGRLLGVPIAARFQPRTILWSALFGAFASLILMTIIPSMLWVGVFGMGLFMSTVFPTMMAFAEKRMIITGKITSTFYIGAGIGAIVFPWLVGVSFDLIGVEALMGIEILLFSGLLLIYRMLTAHDASFSPQG